VNAERLINADDEPGNWMSHARTYDEQNFSPVAEINEANVGELGLAWYDDSKIPAIDLNSSLSALLSFFADLALSLPEKWEIRERWTLEISAPTL